MRKMKNEIGIDIVSLREVLPAIKKLKQKIPGVTIYLFGSVLENTAVRHESDADILIIPKNETKNTSELYAKAWNALTTLLDAGIAPHIIIYNSKSHARLLKEVKQKGLAI